MKETHFFQYHVVCRSSLGVVFNDSHEGGNIVYSLVLKTEKKKLGGSNQRSRECRTTKSEGGGRWRGGGGGLHVSCVPMREQKKKTMRRCNFSSWAVRSAVII